MSLKSIAAAGALACMLGGTAQLSAQLGTPPSPSMPAPAGLPDTPEDKAPVNTTEPDAVGTAGQSTDAATPADRPDLPATASPLPLLLLGGIAALGGAAALRRAR